MSKHTKPTFVTRGGCKLIQPLPMVGRRPERDRFPFHLRHNKPAKNKCKKFVDLS